MSTKVLAIISVVYGVLAQAEGADVPRVVDVTDCEPLIGDSLVSGDPSQAEANTRRIAALMDKLEEGTVIRFAA